MDYINVYDYDNKDYPFQIFLGGRGTGKTYSALNGGIDLPEPFIYMRRTGSEYELCNDSLKFGEGSNPMRSVNTDRGTNYGFISMNKHLSGMYNREPDPKNEGRFIYTGEPKAYACALSTVHNIRGIDLTHCGTLIYDEFIPEIHVTKMKGEADALFNAIETFGRNRELKGKPPLRVFLLANSNNIYNPIFVGLGIVAEIEKMLSRGKFDRYFQERGLAVHLLKSSDKFVEEKRDSALYRLTRGSDFEEMALNNRFAYNDFSLISPKKVSGYRPVVSLGNIYVYNKKGTSEYYFSYSPAKCKHLNDKILQDVKWFRQNYGIDFRHLFSNGFLTFETYDIKERILDVLDIK